MAQIKGTSAQDTAYRQLTALHEFGQMIAAMAGPRMELFSMLTEAAVHGMGVALAPPFFMQEELAQGRLVDIGARPVSGERAYSLIWPEHKAELPALQAFADWLQKEAGAVA